MSNITPCQYDIIKDKHCLSYKYKLEIKHNLGDNLLLALRYSRGIVKYMENAGYLEGVDYVLFRIYGGIRLVTNNSSVMVIAKLLF